MKHLLFLLLFFPFLGFSYSRAYLGYNYLYKEFTEEPLLHHLVHNHGKVEGLEAGYERLPCMGVYFGLIGYMNRAKLDEVRSKDHTKGKNKIGNIEGRIGYAFGPRYLTVCPFLGAGYHHHVRDTNDDALEYDKLTYQWLYFTAGMKIHFPLFSFLETGIHAGIMQMNVAKVDVYLDNTFYSEIYKGERNFKLDLGEKTQYYVEIPFYLRSLKLPSFDLGVVLYYQDMHIGKGNKGKHLDDSTMYGPGSVSIEKGVRIETGFRF